MSTEETPDSRARFYLRQGAPVPASVANHLLNLLDERTRRLEEAEGRRDALMAEYEETMRRLGATLAVVVDQRAEWAVRAKKAEEQLDRVTTERDMASLVLIRLTSHRDLDDVAAEGEQEREAAEWARHGLVEAGYLAPRATP